jgi:hypothetical protein
MGEPARIVGKVRALPAGEERTPDDNWKNWVLFVESEDNGETKATDLIEAHGYLNKSGAELLANMLNEWAGKE